MWMGSCGNNPGIGLTYRFHHRVFAEGSAPLVLAFCSLPPVYSLPWFQVRTLPLAVASATTEIDGLQPPEGSPSYHPPQPQRRVYHSTTLVDHTEARSPLPAMTHFRLQTAWKVFFTTVFCSVTAGCIWRTPYLSYVRR